MSNMYKLSDSSESPKNQILNQDLDFLLHAASRHVTRLFKSHLDALDLTYTQYLVILALDRDKAISVDAIGAQLYLDSGTLTPLLKRLESKNYIKRDRALTDERRLDVFLTEGGKLIQENLYLLRDKIYQNLSLGPSVSTINMLLSKLIRLFQNNGSKKP